MPEMIKHDVADGQVSVTPHGDGWYLVEIGRDRYVKRFNLRDTEYRQLIDAYPLGQAVSDEPMTGRRRH